MASITAPAFNGTLNSNEIYNALFNLRILFQKLAPQTVRRDEIVNAYSKALSKSKEEAENWFDKAADLLHRHRYKHGVKSPVDRGYF